MYHVYTLWDKSTLNWLFSIAQTFSPNNHLKKSNIIKTVYFMHLLSSLYLFLWYWTPNYFYVIKQPKVNYQYWTTGHISLQNKHLKQEKIAIN